MTRGRPDIAAQIATLRRYARVLTRDADAADDLVQATFLRAEEKRATFREGADPKVWLFAILHNLFLDTRRSMQAAQARDRAWAESRAAFAPPSGEMAARLAQVQAAFLALAPEQREALHLVAVEGLSVAEAADILGAPPGTVMSRVARARAALREFEAGKDLPLRVVGGRNERSS